LVDGALRVEIVAPIVDDKWRGLALAVSDYTKTQDDEGQSEWPIPRNQQRLTFTLLDRTTLTNNQLFNIHYGAEHDDDDDPSKQPASSKRKAPAPGMIQDWWTHHTVPMSISSYDFPTPQTDGVDSHRFVENLLEHPVFTPMRVQHPHWQGFLHGVIGDSLIWAEQERDQRMGAPPVQKPLDYLFYEARGTRGDPRERPRNLQYLYKLEPSKDPEGPRRVPVRLDSGWQGFARQFDQPASPRVLDLAAVENPPARARKDAGFQLSRDALLTLDVPVATDGIEVPSREVDPSVPPQDSLSRLIDWWNS
jgi:hypothetical protein